MRRVLLVLAALAACPAWATNFVVVMTDDQRWDTIGPKHSLSGPAMPIVKALADQGMRFTNAFVAGPLCAPSRASLLTGLYIHNHGIKGNHAPLGGATLFDDSSTIATLLHDAGYRTGMVGKYLNDYELLAPYQPPGWDDWRVFSRFAYYDYDLVENGVINHHGHEPADYSTDVLAARAVDFIQSADQRPFFLLFQPLAPHLPAVAAPRHQGAFAGLPQWRPANYNEGDVSDKAPWLQALPPIPLSFRNEIDATIPVQMESQLAVDEAMGAIEAALTAKGIEQDTMIIFIAGDNGFNWGEHRLAGKACPYDECTRTSVFVKYAGVPSANNAAMVETVDVTATVADYAGLSMPINGVSMRPLLEGGALSREATLAEQWFDADPDKNTPRSNPPTFQSARTAQYLYIDYDDADQGTELYDMLTDPAALTNQAANPAYATAKADMAARLDALKAE